jgi:hypothetical protein
MILSDADLKYHLKTGIPFFVGFKTRERFEAAWNLVRDRLMDEYVREHPGRRPFGWWLCDHKQERPIIAQMHRDRPVTRELLLSMGHRKEKHFGFLHTRSYPPYQQHEEDYLEEHGLLADWEIKRLREMDAEDLKRLEEDPHAGIHTRRVYTARTDYDQYDDECM